MLIRDADDGRAARPSRCACCAATWPRSSSPAPTCSPGLGRPRRPRARAEALCQGRTDAEASAVLGVDSGGLAFWVAALRECFEEAGVLVARPAGRIRGRGELLDTSDPAVAARFAAHRDAVNGQRTGLLDVCRPGRPGAGGRRGPLRQPLDHPRAGPTALRHPVLHHRGPTGPDRPPRRRRDHRHHLGPPGRGPGPLRGRRDRAAAPDHRQPAQHRGRTGPPPR